LADQILDAGASQFWQAKSLMQVRHGFGRPNPDAGASQFWQTKSLMQVRHRFGRPNPDAGASEFWQRVRSNRQATDQIGKLLTKSKTGLLIGSGEKPRKNVDSERDAAAKPVGMPIATQNISAGIESRLEKLRDLDLAAC